MNLLNTCTKNCIVLRDYVGEGMGKEESESSKSLDPTPEDLTHLSI